MTTIEDHSGSANRQHTTVATLPGLLVRVGILLLPLLLFVGPVVAQSGDAGNAFCGSNMAQTVKNIFDIIQFGGPLIGGALSLGATVAIPFTRRSDWKKEMKSVRNQGLLWGVIVAPLGTEIVQFILNNIVVGGTSCGF